MSNTLPLEWAPVRMISDDPAKALGHARRKSLVIAKLQTIFGEPKTQVDLVSPYFVPGTTGTESLRRWSGHGVKVRILTNALEATDVPAVHAGYAKRRRQLLSAGVRLFELRRSSRIPQSALRPLGSSSSSLHAKTFAVDGVRVFVGSFNFDPRSARLNTEMGFVIDSPAMAQRLGQAFETTIPAGAYEVHLAQNGTLVWTSGGARTDAEPGSSAWRRAAVWAASRLPIEWLL
jgi:putative cardiolipin synthase